MTKEPPSAKTNTPSSSNLFSNAPTYSHSASTLRVLFLYLLVLSVYSTCMHCYSSNLISEAGGMLMADMVQRHGALQKLDIRCLEDK